MTHPFGVPSAAWSEDPESTRAPGASLRALRRLLDLPPAGLLGLVTALDLLAGLLYWLHTRGVLHSRFFRLARDLGFAECVQYLKFGLILSMLLEWLRARPSPLLKAWAILFGIMLLDDMVGIHETVSKPIVPFVAHLAPAGVRAKDLAEAVVFAVVEGGALLNVAARWLRAPADLLAFSVALLVLMVPLVTFGLVVDLLGGPPRLEDIGEMASMSLLLGFMHARRHARLRATRVNPSAPA